MPCHLSAQMARHELFEHSDGFVLAVSSFKSSHHLISNDDNDNEKERRGEKRDEIEGTERNKEKGREMVSNKAVQL